MDSNYYNQLIAQLTGATGAPGQGGQQVFQGRPPGVQGRPMIPMQQGMQWQPQPWEQQSGQAAGAPGVNIVRPPGGMQGQPLSAGLAQPWQGQDPTQIKPQMTGAPAWQPGKPEMGAWGEQPKPAATAPAWEPLPPKPAPTPGWGPQQPWQQGQPRRLSPGIYQDARGTYRSKTGRR